MKGGFLPVVADVTDVAAADGPNRLVVWVNNELNRDQYAMWSG